MYTAVAVSSLGLAYAYESHVQVQFTIYGSNVREFIVICQGEISVFSLSFFATLKFTSAPECLKIKIKLKLILDSMTKKKIKK